MNKYLHKFEYMHTHKICIHTYKKKKKQQRDKKLVPFLILLLFPPSPRLKPLKRKKKKIFLGIFFSFYLVRDLIGTDE